MLATARAMGLLVLKAKISPKAEYTFIYFFSSHVTVEWIFLTTNFYFLTVTELTAIEMGAFFFLPF